MATNAENRAIVERWFTSLWGHQCDLSVIDELAVTDVLLQYSMDKPRRGREAVKAFLTKFREAFPNLESTIVGELTSERDFVVVHWELLGTHTGPAFDDFYIGPLPAASGRTIQVDGHTAVRLERVKFVEKAIWS